MQVRATELQYASSTWYTTIGLLNKFRHKTKDACALGIEVPQGPATLQSINQIAFPRLGGGGDVNCFNICTNTTTTTVVFEQQKVAFGPSSDSTFPNPHLHPNFWNSLASNKLYHLCGYHKSNAHVHRHNHEMIHEMNEKSR